MTTAMPSRTNGWSSTLRILIRVSSLMPFVLSLGVPVWAMDPSLQISQYAHTAWTLRDGRFKGYPKSFTQTADGYLWLGNEFGLIRFDGVRFTEWHLPDANPLSDRAVVKLLAGRDGSLWVGTIDGLAQIIDDRVIEYRELRGHYVAALLEDRDGTIWAGTGGRFTNDARLCAIRRGDVRCHDDRQQFGRNVSALYQDRHGAIWVGATKGLWRWREPLADPFALPSPNAEIHSIAEDHRGALLIALNRDIRQLADTALAHYPLRGTPPGLKPTAMLRDRDGNLWIGTQDQGLLRVGQHGVERFAREDGLSGDFVFDLLEDREGNIWVATSNGLDRFRAYTVARVSTEQGLTASSVLSVQVAKDGSVWLGTVNGLNQWKDGRITSYRTRPDLPRDVIASLYDDGRGRLWVASARGLLHVEDGRTQAAALRAGGHVQAIAEDRAGDLWISEQDSGLVRLRRGMVAETIPWTRFGNAIGRVLAVDPSTGGLWLGFFQGGVSYLENGQVRASFAEAQGLKGEVTSLFFDRKGALWVSTRAGLSRLKDGVVTTLSGRNGLPCDAVHWAIEDDVDSFWIYTACGLVRVAGAEMDAWARAPARTVPLTIYTELDGVPAHSDLGSYGPKVAKSADGRLWFTTYDGAAVVDPHHLPFNKVPPPVRIEAVIADGKTHAPAPHLDLPPRLRDLRIDYTALSLVSPEKVRFRYKLEGRDQDWVDVGNSRQAVYTDLAPDLYRFRVISANNDGVWNNEGDVLEFSILPAFHQTVAFRVAMTLFAIALLWTLYRAHLRRMAAQINMRFEERLAERTRIARELHDTLLQGTLSVSMQLYVVVDEVVDQPVKAKLLHVLQRFNHVVEEGRRTIQGLRSHPLLGDDLEQALTRDATAFRGQQAIEICVVVEGKPRPIQPLVRDAIYRIAREAIANAFRHARATVVDIKVAYSSESFLVRVSDDGLGIEPRVLESGRSGHWGVFGMRERSQQIGATVKLSSRLGSGTEVELVVPAHVAFQDAAPRPADRWFHFKRWLYSERESSR
jgi:ligand-binding sensor domain-containing protein/signal transduction histidine kinase